MYDIRLSIDSRLEQVRVLSGALRGIGKELALSESEIGQLELMMVEAVNNVIEHAYELQAGNDVHVRFEQRGNTVYLIISDRGKPIPAEVQEEIGEMPDPLALPDGGWGLALIHALADSIRYVCSPEGNHLYVIKQVG
jgi:serine/threonine-protein kinase RsbW